MSNKIIQAMIDRRIRSYYMLALGVVLLDQMTKNWASTELSYGIAEPITSFFNFTLLHNHGAAFSFLSDAGGWQRWFFGVIAIVVSFVLVVWIAKLPSEKRFEALALSLILGGAIGNLYDRMVLGYVVDFVVLHYEQHAWPAFNIADMGISCGAAMLIYDMFFNKDVEAETGTDAESKESSDLKSND
ncbi:MAG: signal peptidase II [Cellvibrionaceae bacterium]